MRKVLGNKSPAQLANELIDGSKLRDVAVRKALLEGGQPAIDASTDPVIALARLVDPEFREIRKDYEDHFSARSKPRTAPSLARASRFTERRFTRMQPSRCASLTAR